MYGVLIETLWNVNVNNTMNLVFIVLVLIETLWNVNDDPERKIAIIEQVLIETLWNVNLVAPKILRLRKPF